MSVSSFWKHIIFGSNAYSSFLCGMTCLSTSSAWECHFLETFPISGYSWPKMILVWNLGDGSEMAGIVLHKFPWLAGGSDSHSHAGTGQLVFSLTVSSSSSWLLTLLTHSNFSIIVSFLLGFSAKHELPIDFSARYLFVVLFQQLHVPRLSDQSAGDSFAPPTFSLGSSRSHFSPHFCEVCFLH